MINIFLFYSLYPAIVAGGCLLLCYKAYRSNAEIPYLKIFINLAIINICQTILYLSLQKHFLIATYAADIYLIAAYFLFTHFMQLAFNLSGNALYGWEKYLYIPPIILTILHVLGLMVNGYRFESNALVHNDGALSWTFDIFLLLSSIVIIVTFISNAKTIKNDYLQASRNIIALISFIPFVLAAALLVILSNTDAIIPVVVIIPSMSLYIVFVFYYISRSEIIDLTIGPSAFLKRLKIAYLLLSSLRTKQDLDNFNRQLQVLRYNEAMQKHKNNYNEAAKELKVHPTTLRNALKN